MAIFRKIHTTFWSDPFTSQLSNDRKLFYLYLITNERTKQCGIYEITKRHIAFDLQCNVDTVDKHISYFTKAGKLMYNESTNELALKNWARYNNSTSPKVQSCINKELLNVKDRVLIEYIYSMDTQSQEEEEKEKDPEQEYRRKFLSQIAKDDLDVKNQEYFEIALAFWKLFRQINIEAGAPTTTIDKAKGTWIDDIRLLIETDGAKKEALREIWHWLPTDDFWKKNISSTKKLRKQFEKLVKEKNYGKNGQNLNETKQRLEAVGSVLSGIFAEWDKEGQ